MGARLARALVAVAFLAIAGTAVADDLTQAQDRGLELFRAARYSEALPHFEKALDLAEARYGAGDPAIATDLNNLAETRRLLTQYDRAEPLYLRAIALDEKAGKDAGPGLATSLNNLALVYRAQKRFPEAEKLYLRSLSLLERTLGPNHPDVAKSLNNLAVLYRVEGQPEKARPLAERAVTIAERSLGPQNATTKVFRQNLAALGTAAPPASGKAPAARSAPAAKPAAAAKPSASKPPAAKPAAAPPPSAKAASGRGYAIHVESVRDAAVVAGEWRNLVKKYPSLAPLPPRPAEAVEIPGKGTFFRIAGGSFASRDEAARACAPLKAAGAYCAILPP